MVSPLPPEEFGQNPAELPACRHLPQNKPKGFTATQTTAGSCKTRWVGEPAWLNEASTGEKNALTAISLQEGCEPRFCVLEKLGNCWHGVLSLPIRQRRWGQALTLQLRSNEVSGSSRSQARGPKEPEGQKNEAQQTD